jgi:hypothetical protein
MAETCSRLIAVSGIFQSKGVISNKYALNTEEGLQNNSINYFISV